MKIPALTLLSFLMFQLPAFSSDQRLCEWVRDDLRETLQNIDKADVLIRQTKVYSIGIFHGFDISLKWVTMCYANSPTLERSIIQFLFHVAFTTHLSNAKVSYSTPTAVQDRIQELRKKVEALKAELQCQKGFSLL